MEFGKIGDTHRLQIAMLTDWTKKYCRETCQFIHDLYADAHPKDMPRVDLYLLPVYDSESASLQMAHGRMKFKHSTAPQLITFDSILIGSPTKEALATFLRTASARQHHYLMTPEGARPLVIDRSCNCFDPSHNHSLLQSSAENSTAQSRKESDKPSLKEIPRKIKPNTTA